MASLTYQALTRSMLVILLVVVALTTARSAHFVEGNQVNQEPDVPSNLVDTGLTPLQLEMLAQKLSEYNNQIPQIPSAWDRLIRNPEVKRQSRYRQCYFNPISCFRK